MQTITSTPIRKGAYYSFLEKIKIKLNDGINPHIGTSRPEQIKKDLERYEGLKVKYEGKDPLYKFTLTE